MKLLISLLGLVCAAPVFAHKVIGIADGDTLTLLVQKEQIKVRLANIDAPEPAQAFGEKSRMSLHGLCWGKDAQYKEQDIDHYGRVVAVVTCGGVEANRSQIERGLAWVYPKYNKDLSLPGLEAGARRDRLGLWAASQPVPPWEFRRPKLKKAAATEESIEGICFVDRRGEYRIVDGAKKRGC